MLALLRDDLLSENRTGLAKTLFAWESENITRLGIEQIWEPTPFPLERGGEAMSPVSEDMVARLESMIRITPRKIWADEA
ncbi:hypothetical protein DK389_00945 [Methylobacterium durans]|uniref:Uncharacterized protein n=2 Tax=Methylobacterium durans TaxID=2202825 RepID=A0A2U8W162_9HYPH|nr:hypothetical protein DK389_00945 [Methylobacterium durans]